eukprot:scaffold1006_cov158-Skeletonema_marinoi.AAC.3
MHGPVCSLCCVLYFEEHLVEEHRIKIEQADAQDKEQQNHLINSLYAQNLHMRGCCCHPTSNPSVMINRTIALSILKTKLTPSVTKVWSTWTQNITQLKRIVVPWRHIWKKFMIALVILNPHGSREKVRIKTIEITDARSTATQQLPNVHISTKLKEIKDALKSSCCAADGVLSQMGPMCCFGAPGNLTDLTMPMERKERKERNLTNQSNETATKEERS